MPEQKSLFSPPADKCLSTDKLAKIFDNVGASYKYYWFLSILEEVHKGSTRRLDAYDLAISMVAQAWYPATYYHLDLGWRDGIKEAINELNQDGINFRNQEEIKGAIRYKVEIDPDFRKIILNIFLLVPQRFLSPWIGSHSNKDGYEIAKEFVKGSPYRIERSKKGVFIELEPEWERYFLDNYEILQDFAKWNLGLYLQQRNPLVPNLMEKIQKPGDRKSMKLQQDFWHDLIKGGMEVKCIYTDKPLRIGKYDLDHFVPWNFVAHNLLWNLIPADPSINSSKSDKLPSLNLYLDKFAQLQQRALFTYIDRKGKNSKVLEDYLTIRKSADEIVLLDLEELGSFYSDVFEPLVLTAKTVGFEEWKQ